MTRASTKANPPPPAEIVGPADGAGARPVQAVTGRRVRPEKEQFVLEDAPVLADVVEAIQRCPSCKADNPVSAWEENNDACPECEWTASALSVPTEDDDDQRLSEVELLFETLGETSDEDEYLLIVSHLPNYNQDHKANTTALKKFCRNLRGSEVNLDFMETVRRSCECPCLPPGEEGRFLFVLSKVNGPDRGFKRRWDDSITKPSREEKASIAAPPPQATYAPAPAKSAKDELVESVELLKTIHSIMGVGRQNPPPPPPPQIQGETDPFASATASFDLLAKAKDLMSDLGGGAGGGDHWSVGLVKSLRIGDVIVEGLKWLGPLAVAKMNAPADNGAANQPSGSQPPPPREMPAGSAPATQAAAPNCPTGPTGPAPAPAAPPPTISPEAIVVLEKVVAEIRGYENDEDSDQLDDRVTRAAAAVRTLPQETRALISDVPQVYLLPALISFNPAWGDLAHFKDTGKFIDALLMELEEEETSEEGTSELLHFPLPTEVEKENTNDNENKSSKEAD